MLPRQSAPRSAKSAERIEGATSGFVIVPVMGWVAGGMVVMSTPCCNGCLWSASVGVAGRLEFLLLLSELSELGHVLGLLAGRGHEVGLLLQRNRLVDLAA